MIEEFLQRFPAWPRSLADALSDYVAYAIQGSDAWITAEKYYREETTKTYETKYPAVRGYAWHQQFTADLMKPTNQQFIASFNQEKPYSVFPLDAAQKIAITPQIREYLQSIGVPENEWGAATMLDNHWWWGFRPYILTRFDTRLFSSVQNFFNYKFTPNFGPFVQSYMFIMSYSQVELYGGNTELLISAKGQPKPFSGVSSILALHENGATLPGVDIQKLYEFNTYLNGYKKFSAQVEAEAKNISYAAESEILNYSKSLQQQLEQEKRSIENLAIDLNNQMQVEAASVQRDLTNTLLTAQSLAAQLSGGLR